MADRKIINETKDDEDIIFMEFKEICTILEKLGGGLRAEESKYATTIDLNFKFQLGKREKI